MSSTTNISKALLDLLKGSNQGTPQGNRSPGQAYQEERDDIRLESYEKERSLSPRELQKWKKSLFSVYIGRLPTDTTVRELVQFFSQVGVPKDAYIHPPEGNQSYTFGFLRYGTLEEARKAVACMNGRILGNRHLMVEISSETRAILNNYDKEENGVCDAQDRLIRKEYPTFRRPSLPVNGEEFVQSKLHQSIAKLKSDQVSVVDAGCKDIEESNGRSFLNQLEEILKKVIKDVPGETTTKSTAEEGPVCTLRLEDIRLNPMETPKTNQSVESPTLQNVGNRLPVNIEQSSSGSDGCKMREDTQQDSPVTPKSPESLGSPPINGEKHSPINTVHPYGKPAQSFVSGHPGYVGLNMRQKILQRSPETLKTSSSLESPPSNGDKLSPVTNSQHPYGKPVHNSIACNPGSVCLREDMRQNSPESHQSIQSPSSSPMNGENHSPLNSNHSPLRPISNDITFLTKSTGLNNGFTDPQSEHYKHYETANIPMETRKTETHYTTKATLPGDVLSMQELLISDAQTDRKGSSIDPYMLSKMRDIPCQDARQFQSEKRPVAPCKRSSTDTQVSSMSRTDTAVDAVALKPLTSKDNESSSMKILDTQRRTSSSAAKDNIEHPSLSFGGRISDILDEKPGRHSGNKPQVVTVNNDREEISFQQEPTFDQNQSKEQTPPQQGHFLPGKQDRQKQPPLEQVQPLPRQEQLSLQDRHQQPPLQDKQEQPPLEQEQPLPRQEQLSLQDRHQQPPLQDKQEQPSLEQEQPLPRQEQLSLQDRHQQPPLQDKQEQPPLEQVQPLPRQEQLSLHDRHQQPPLQDKQEQPPLEQEQPLPRQEQLSLQDRHQQPPLQGKQEQPPLEQEQPLPRQEQLSLQDRHQQPPLQDKQEQPPLEQEQPLPRQEQLSLQDRHQQPPLQDKQEQPPLEQEQPSFHDQTSLEDGQPKMPLQDKQEQTLLKGQREQTLQDHQKQAALEQKQPPFEDKMSFDDRRQQLASRDKRTHTTSQGQGKQMPLQQWEPALHEQQEQPLPLQNQQVQPPLQQQQLLLKQRSVHELQLKLGVILKENERLQSALPEHYKDKRTSKMYPDKEMSNLDESIHNYEVKYQREIEITVARNAEHELLYEREKLSAAFDSNLQKEIDLELQMEVLKNEIKLSNMANQLLVFYQKRNDMQ